MTNKQERNVLAAIKRFNKECEQGEYTDTGEARELLNWIVDVIEDKAVKP